MHKARRPGLPLRVYFLVHDTSLEEQRYLSAIKYESWARPLQPDNLSTRASHPMNLSLAR